MYSKGKIGIILPHISGNTDIEFVDAIHRKTVEYGYDTIVISGVINYVDQHLELPYSKGQINIYDIILHGDFDGFIFDANAFCSEKLRRSLLELLRKKNKPCVVVNYEQKYFPVTSADESILLYTSAMHLINKHNCRNLYCIGGNKGDIPSEKRINGFRRAMEESGIAYDESRIIYGNYWRGIPRETAIGIAEGKIETPDGIVCGNDIMAIELTRTLNENGIRVPEDIKVAGGDGRTTSQTERVTITTVAGQERINGFLAITKLLEMIGENISDTEFSPELIIGESCGCGNSGNICRNDALSDIREYAGAVFEMIEHRKTNSHGEIIRRMSECRNIYDVIGTFLGCCYMIPTSIKAELCLCDDWCRNLNDPTIYRCSGLPEKMLLGIETGNDEKMISFLTKDIFPSLTQKHEPRLTVVTSLHYKGQIFGYVGFTYPKAVRIVLDEFYMSWCDAVSSGLNTVQNHMYKEYVNKRIESLSEFAPVLGIYNKRGLIGKLMNLFSENRNLSVTLFLISYLKEERVHYSVPPINAIVNALRLSDDDSVLASISADVVAVAVTSGKIVTEENMTEVIAEKINEIFKGSMFIKSDRIAVASASLSVSEMFDIESVMYSLENKMSGRKIDLSSGIYNYREKFVRLQIDIFKYPEKDWNIEAITKEMGLSKSHFHRLYKEFFGTNCKDDIIAARIDKVKWYLDNTALTVAAIADKCGYTNNSHFVRQFSSRTGLTPTEYRKKNKTAKKMG